MKCVRLKKGENHVKIVFVERKLLSSALQLSFLHPWRQRKPANTAVKAVCYLLGSEWNTLHTYARCFSPPSYARKKWDRILHQFLTRQYLSTNTDDILKI
jgi:hypothetical protein